VDTCRAIATSLEINDAVSQSIIRVVERQSRLFPSNLHLNNKGDEPPRLFMSSRGIVWRRVMSCIEEHHRSTYYLLNRLNAVDFNYTNLSYRMGNLCIHVLAAANYVFPEVTEWAVLKDKVLLNARVLARANLCVLGLVLAFIHLHEVWDSTYRNFSSADNLEPADQFRYQAILSVRKAVVDLLNNIIGNIISKRGGDARQLCDVM